MAKSGKKLAVAIVVLVVAVALATTATFAWFTMNQTATVGNIDVNVTSETAGLYVTLDTADGYYTDVNANADDGKGGKVVGTGVELKDLTGSVAVNGTLSIKDQGNNAVTWIESLSAGQTNGFLKFDVFFRASINTADTVSNVFVDVATAADKSVVNSTKDANNKPIKYWGTADEFLAAYGVALNAKAQASDAANNAFQADAKNAARVAFQSTSADGTATATKIWNPGKGAGFSTALNGSASGARNLAQDYLSKTLGQPALPTTIGAEAADNNGDISDNAFKKVVELKKSSSADYYEGKITVYVYLEGIDSDCCDSVLKDSLSISLKFNLNAVTTPKAN